MVYKCPSVTCQCVFQVFIHLQSHHRDNHGFSLYKQDELHYRINHENNEDGMGKSQMATQSKEKKTQSYNTKVYPNKCQFCTRTLLDSIDGHCNEAQYNVLTHVCPCGGASRNFKTLSNEEECFYRCKEPKVQNIPYKTNTGTKLQRKLKCNHCQKIFYSHSSRNLHEKAHKRTSYECHCGYRCINFVNFKCHYLRIHKVRLPFEFEKKYRSKSKPDASEYNIDEHKLPAKDKNKNDPKTICRRKRDQAEMKSVGLSKSGSYHPKCSFCPRTFKSNEARQHHEENHNLLTFTCPPPCGAAFLKFAHLKMHFTTRHNVRISDAQRDSYKIKEKFADSTLNKNKGGLFAASSRGPQLPVSKSHEIEKTYKSKGELTKENQIISDLKTVEKSKSRNRPKCKLCQRQFPSKKERDHHEKIHHQMTYRCPYPCGGAFASFSTLRCHNQLIHNRVLLRADENSYKISDYKSTIHIFAKYKNKGNTKEINPNSNSKRNRKNTQNGEVQSKQKSIPKMTLIKSVEGIFEVATTKDQNTLIEDKGNTAIIPIKNKGRHWTCRLCHRKFNTGDAKDSHEAHHDMMKFKCPYPCQNMFIEFKKLQTHAKKKHQILLPHFNKDLYKTSANVSAVDQNSHSYIPEGESKEPVTEQTLEEVKLNVVQHLSINAVQDSIAKVGIDEKHVKKEEVNIDTIIEDTICDTKPERGTSTPLLSELLDFRKVLNPKEKTSQIETLNSYSLTDDSENQYEQEDIPVGLNESLAARIPTESISTQIPTESLDSYTTRASHSQLTRKDVGRKFSDKSHGSSGDDANVLGKVQDQLNDPEMHNNVPGKPHEVVQVKNVRDPSSTQQESNSLEHQPQVQHNYEDEGRVPERKTVLSISQFGSAPPTPDYHVHSQNSGGNEFVMNSNSSGGQHSQEVPNTCGCQPVAGFPFSRQNCGSVATVTPKDNRLTPDNQPSGQTPEQSSQTWLHRHELHDQTQKIFNLFDFAGSQSNVRNHHPIWPQNTSVEFHDYETPIIPLCSNGLANEIQFLRRYPCDARHNITSRSQTMLGFQNHGSSLASPEGGNYMHCDSVNFRDSRPPSYGCFGNPSSVSINLVQRSDSSPVVNTGSWSSHGQLPNTQRNLLGNPLNSGEKYFTDNADRSSVSSLLSSAPTESPLLSTMDREEKRFFKMVISDLGRVYGERKSLVELEIGKILHHAQYSASLETYKATRLAPQNATSVPDDNNRVLTEQQNEDFCINRILPILKRLDNDRKMWAKLKIHEAFY